VKTLFRLLAVMAAALSAVSCAPRQAVVTPRPPAVKRPSAQPQVAAAARPLMAPLSSAKLATLHANEVGRIPILMYHAINGPSFHGRRYDPNGLNIAPETFRKHLDLMYAAHWYPVNMRDLLTSHIDIPAGKTPVVITFDDARGTQFHYLKDGRIDPNCAVGILEAFHKKHGDWPLRATFYVLPKSAWNPAPFWQPGTETRKLRYLASEDFEIANHTTTHRLMGRLPAAQIDWEMAECQRYVADRVPGVVMDTMALPGGDAPKNHALWPRLLNGRLGKIVYHNRCILMAWGGPSRAWSDKKFDPDRVTRIGCGPGWVERVLAQLSQGKIREYISDGNPDTVAIPRIEAKDVNPKRLDGARLVIYDIGKPTKARVLTAKKMASRT